VVHTARVPWEEGVQRGAYYPGTMGRRVYNVAHTTRYHGRVVGIPPYYASSLPWWVYTLLLCSTPYTPGYTTVSSLLPAGSVVSVGRIARTVTRPWALL